MRNILIMAALCLFHGGAAHAQYQEQQVFSPYPQPTFLNAPEQQAARPAAPVSQNRYMVYPGREPYGDRYGYIPRHPGDYRDAVDRGQWEGGGGASMPRRSFGGY